MSLSRSSVDSRTSALRDEIRTYYNQKGFYIDHDTYNNCFQTIKSWINLEALAPYLLKHGLAKDSGDVDQLISPFLGRSQKLNALRQLAETNGGRYGFFILYRCFCESMEEVPYGHGDVVDELEKYATAHSIKPDWLEASGQPSPICPEWEVGTDEPGGQSSISQISRPGVPSHTGQSNDNLFPVQESRPPGRDVTLDQPTHHRSIATNLRQSQTSVSPTSTNHAQRSNVPLSHLSPPTASNFHGEEAERDNPIDDNSSTVSAQVSETHSTSMSSYVTQGEFPNPIQHTSTNISEGDMRSGSTPV